jgi:hypothetical protein
MPLYYPSMVVDITLRFDETLQVVDSPSGATKQQSVGDLGTDTAGGRDSVTGLDSSGKPFKNKSVIGTAYGKKAVPPTPSTQLQPLVFRSDNLTQIANRVPKRASVEIPSPRQAGKFNLTFDYRDLPIDPRLLKGAGIEIYLGAVPADQFAKGIGGQRSIDSKQLLSILRTRDAAMPRYEDLLITGVVDEMNVEHGEKGSEVTIDGRDLRGIFLDGKIAPAKVAKVNLRQPISKVVADILATAEPEMGLRIDVFSQDFLGPEPMPVDAEGLLRVRLGADGEGSGKSQPAGGDKLSYWDLVTKYCMLVGAIPYFIGPRLYIRPARVVTLTIVPSNWYSRRNTPFIGGKPRRIPNEYDDGTTGDRELVTRLMVYGQDISRLGFGRKFQGVKVPTVECVSIDDRKRGAEKLLIAQWPPAESKPAKMTGDENKIRIPVPGVRDKARLETVARDIYEEIGHSEMGGSCDTKSLASFGGDNDDADMLRIRPTASVEFGIDARRLQSKAPLVSILSEHRRKSFSELAAEFQARGLTEDLSRALAASSLGAVVNQLRWFRVGNCKFDWDAGSGVKISFDFQNYVISRHSEPRFDAPPAKQTGAPKKRTVNKPPPDRGEELRRAEGEVEARHERSPASFAGARAKGSAGNAGEGDSGVLHALAGDTVLSAIKRAGGNPGSIGVVGGK